MKIFSLMIFLAALLMLPAAHAQLVHDPDARSDEEICSYMISLAEQARRIPPGLLQAIAQVESGRYVRGRSVSEPWPWTVSSPQQGGKFYKTKQESVAATEALKDRGVNNIDVGCMQINLFYHGRGFQSIAEAIEPVNNIAYATEYIGVLYDRYDDWGEAVKHYHSSDPQKNSFYLEKVIAAWRRSGEAQSSPYLSELQAALGKNTVPPLPPTAESEQELAQSTLSFAEELKRRVIEIQDGIAQEDELQNQQENLEELRIWEDWQQVKNLGDIKGKDPDDYIDRLDSTF